MAEIPLGLLGFAAGAMGAGRTSQHPMGFGEALSGGLLSGLQNYGMLSDVENRRQAAQMQQMQMMQQMAQQTQAQKQAAQRQQALQQFSQSLPEDQRLLAQAAPDAFIGAKVKSAFATPERTALMQELEAAGYKPGTPEYTNAILRARMPAPKAPTERFRPVTPEEAKQYGLPPGGVYQVSENTGQVRQVTGPGSGGVQISGYDDQGRPLIQVGGRQIPGGSTELTGAQLSRTQDDISTLMDAQARVAKIGEYWRPEFQQLGTRFSSAVAAGKEKLGVELPPEDKQQLAAFTNAKAAALDDLNRTLQELSGAAVTESEAKRFAAVQPVVGTGLLDGDSPTEFETKLRARQRDLRLALARKIYLMTNGIDHDIAQGDTGGVTIGEMPKIIDRRGAELEQQFISEGLSPEDAQARAEQQLRQEFGL